MRIIATCLTGLACSVITTSVFAQGLISWANTATTLISLNGSSLPVRADLQTTYHFGLFIAPLGTPAPANGWAGTDDPNWQFVAAYTMNSTAAVGAGRMQNSGVATVIGYEAGTSVNLIVRAWQSSSGGADWPAARAGLTVIGQSAMGTAVLGGGVYPVASAFGVGPGKIGGFNFGCLGCEAPVFTLHPSNKVVRLGDNVTLTASVANHPFFTVAYQWRKQFVPIAGATNSYLDLTNVTLADAGNYSVIAGHYSPGPPYILYGTAASAVATVTVLVPAQLGSLSYTVNNQFQFTVTGSAGSNYVVQVATNLSAPTVWVPLFTNASPFTFVDSNAQNFPQRFYRAQAR